MWNRAPLSLVDVESAYQQAKDVPGLAVSGTLRRGSQPGGMDLVVDAQRNEWRTYANVNDLYADPVGPWGALFGVDHFGSQTAAPSSSPNARPANCLATDAAISFAEAAASAGHRNARCGN